MQTRRSERRTRAWRTASPGSFLSDPPPDTEKGFKCENPVDVLNGSQNSLIHRRRPLHRARNSAHYLSVLYRKICLRGQSI